MTEGYARRLEGSWASCVGQLRTMNDETMTPALPVTGEILDPASLCVVIVAPVRSNMVCTPSRCLLRANAESSTKTPVLSGPTASPF